MAKHLASKRIEESWSQLPNNHWVGMTADGRKAQAKELSVVITEMRGWDVAWTDVAFAFVTFDVIQ
jgi:hypothetical protein